MSFFPILILYIIYTFIVLSLNYYMSLFSSKEQYTKDELKNIKPHFKNIWQKLTFNYNSVVFIFILILFSLFGVLVPNISSYWLLNSILPFALVYFIFPFISKHFQNQKVAESEGLNDNILNLFIDYYQVAILGFGLGNMSAFSQNWFANPQMYSFLLFTVNIVGSIILLEYTLIAVSKENK